MAADLSRGSQNTAASSARRLEPENVPKIKEGDRSEGAHGSRAVEDTGETPMEVDVEDNEVEVGGSPKVDSVPTGGAARNSKQFLKPLSPNATLSKMDFNKMSLEDVDHLISR